MVEFISLREMQLQVDHWCQQFNPPYFPPLSVMAQISEESGELARNLNNMYGGRVKKEADQEKKIGEEICDIIFALICLANSHSIDLDKTWKDTISARCNRDKDRYEKK
jgi:NTP pyrophosphatase (non-canonical NTP hydrolase)